ncbi:tyrosine-type recombinase/integrase [Paenibacillus popilliae]|uniref:tyrosine-type recombinase/integrase n=1 Tax=Paenibacillus popilliae TaxID=78057 RepID=UPI00278C516C|nr:tyrosine-type recombinase/integrase [Paenibacillus popilliae]
MVKTGKPLTIFRSDAYNNFSFVVLISYTVIHYHANIRKALQYAVKTKLITANPADLVERPKKNNNELGQRIKPGYITQNSPILLSRHGFRRIRYHDLRHSCASLLLASGIGMKEVQEWLGHNDYVTTANIYSHLEYSTKISSAQAMSKRIKI